MTRSTTAPKNWRATPRVGLVLGAGGLTGFAYHSGALAALESLTGWDPRTADLILGTSAGSGVGAMLRGGVPVGNVLAHLLSVPSNPADMARLRVLSGREMNSPSPFWFGPGSPRLLLQELSRPWRARPSRVAVSLLPNGRIPTEFVGDRARALHGIDWPADPFWACAVRLSNGERVVFGHEDSCTGVGPVDVGTAIEASSAIPGFFQPVSVDGDRFIDGAIHSPTNAELLADGDFDLVIIVSPMSASKLDAIRSLDAPLRLAAARSLASEVDELEQAGTAVLVVEPGHEEIRTMGPINMDPTRIIPTILQANASTMDRIDQPDNHKILARLRTAAESVPSPPDVAYPDAITGSTP